MAEGGNSGIGEKNKKVEKKIDEEIYKKCVKVVIYSA